MDKYNIPEIHKECLLTMLSHLHNLFKKYNIHYFIDGGSLLGAVRENGLIPHDDDIDLGILEKEWNKLPNILKELCDDKYQINYQIETNIIKVFIPKLWVKEKDTERIIGTPTIDIFKWKKANKKIELKSLEDRQNYPNCYYNKEELQPLKIYNFNGLKVYGANNPYPYLYRYYGNDCLKVRKVEYRNPNNMYEKSKTIIIS